MSLQKLGRPRKYTPLGCHRAQVWEAGSREGQKNSAGFGIPGDLRVVLMACHAMCHTYPSQAPVFTCCQGSV